MEDIEERLTMRDILSYTDKFMALYKNEMELLSPAILLQTMFAGK